MSKNGKHIGGRPAKYQKCFAEELIRFFDVPKSKEYIKSEKIITKSNGTTETFREYGIMAEDLPTLEKFARKIRVIYETLLEWSRARYPDDWEPKHLAGRLKYPEFAEAYNIAKQMQKEFLTDNGLKGLYPPATFIFVSKNVTDMRDVKEFKGEMDHSTKGRSITGFNYLKPPAEDAVYDTDDQTNDQTGSSLPASTG